MKKGIAVIGEGRPVAYTVLEKGTPVVSQPGLRFGTLDRVLDDSRGNTLHGIVVATRAGRRFVARDCIEAMTTTQIRCSLSGEQVNALPEVPSRPGSRRKPWPARRA